MKEEVDLDEVPQTINENVIVEEIDERENHPTFCADCREVANGLTILAELLYNDNVPHPWVCDNCTEKRGDDR